jgi:hypothetical protein
MEPNGWAWVSVTEISLLSESNSIYLVITLTPFLTISFFDSAVLVVRDVTTAIVTHSFFSLSYLYIGKEFPKKTTDF